MPKTTHLTAVTDLNRGVSMQLLKAALLTGDKQAHRFTVACTRGGEAISLAGAIVTGYFIRSDGTTVIISGAVKDGSAVVVLPAACYAVIGRFSLVIKAALGDVVETIFWAEGAVSRSQTDAIVDPGVTLPSLDELLARIEDMEAATTEARQAAQTALDAAAFAQSAAADPIINTMQGRGAAHVWDASAKRLQGLRIFGRTTVYNPTPQASATPVGPGYKGSVGVTVTGKNLFNNNGVTFAVGLINSAGEVDATNANYVHTETYIPVRPNTAYVFSGSIVTESSHNTVAFYTSDKQFISRYSAGVAGQNAQFTTPSNCYFIRFNAASVYQPDTIQLEVGTTATAYAAYTEQKASMATGSLHGVKVSSGGNYTDESGQMWLADYIDGAAGQRVSTIPGVTYTGSNFAPTAANEAGTAYQMALPSAGYPIAYGTDQTGMVFSNRLPTISRERVINGEQGIAINNTHAIICVSGVTTLEGIVAWLAAEPLTVYYRPATPAGAVTAMTAEEAAAFKALHTNYPNTTLYNDVDAWMSASYVADVKRYIDSRIAAIAAAVL